MDCWQLETYVLPRWGKRGIREISKRDVKRLLEDLAAGTIARGGEPTKVAPRNLRAVLSKMFEWATDQEILPANPAAGVKLPSQVRRHLKKGGRDRVLSDEEIGILWRDLDQLEADAEIKSQAPVSAAAFRLILLTAQRPGEVFSMRWCDVEDGEWWVVPAEVAKNGEANRVYLSPQARQVLRDLHAHTGGGRWVLASPYKEGAHLTTIKTANNGILARTGMRHWTPHDLRRTAASKMSSMGTDRRVLQAILNHKDHSVTAVYDRYSLDREKHEALTKWGRRVGELVGGEPEGAVVPFPAKVQSAFGEPGRRSKRG